MKRSFLTAGLLVALCAAPVIGYNAPVYAGNSSVEATLQNYGDVSMFYQTLINTGVINELNENTHYTVFAPTNAAFAEIRRQNYPCFYSEQCRPQIAALLRNHIVPNSYSLSDLKTYGQGVQTMGTRRLVVTEEYVGKYTVNGQNILSNGDTGSNNIYRINRVISDPQEMAQFKTVNVVPVIAPTGSVSTTRDTITERTYHVPSPTSSAYPSGPMDPYPANPQDNMTETTTVIDRYTTESQ
jgi:uncharacterized surface protein with fasciclin (FAS1) repeats